MSSLARHSDIIDFAQEFVSTDIDFIDKEVLINTNDLLHLAVLLAWAENIKDREVNTSFVLDLNKSISMNRHINVRSLGFSFSNQGQKVNVQPLNFHITKSDLYDFINDVFNTSDSRTYHGITMQELISAFKQAKDAELTEYKFKERSNNIGIGANIFRFRYDDEDTGKKYYVIDNEPSNTGYFNDLVISKADGTTTTLTILLHKRIYDDPNSVIPKQIIQLMPKDAEGFTQIRFLSHCCYFHHYGKEDDKEINYFDLR